MLNVNWMLGFMVLLGWWVDGKLRGRLRAPLLERVFALMARRNLARRPLVERLAVDAEVDDALGLEAVLVLAAGHSDDGAVPDGVVVRLDRGDDDLGLASGHVVAGDGAVGDAVGVRADDEVGVLFRDGAQVALGVGLGLQDAVGGRDAVGVLEVDEHGALGVELEGAGAQGAVVVPEVRPRLARAVGASALRVRDVLGGVGLDELHERGADGAGAVEQVAQFALEDVVAADVERLGDEFGARRDEADALLLVLGLGFLRGLARGLGGVLDALLREALGLLGPLVALPAEVPQRLNVVRRDGAVRVGVLPSAVLGFDGLGLRAQERRDGGEHVAGEFPELLRLEGEHGVGGDVRDVDDGGVVHGVWWVVGCAARGDVMGVEQVFDWESTVT